MPHIGKNYAEVGLLRKTKAISVEGSVSAPWPDRVDFRPVANLQHTPETKPLVSNAFIDRLATQSNIGNGLEVVAPKSITTVRYIQAAVSTLLWRKNDGNFAIIPISWMSVVSVLD